MNVKMRNKLIAAPYTIWMIGFIIIPLIFVIYYGLTNEMNVFTLDNLKNFFNPINFKSFTKAFKLSFISTVICLVVSYPIALIFRNSKSKKSSSIVYIFILPMWMNGLLRIYAWLTLIEKRGVINLLLTALNLPNINIVNTEIAIILGMVYDYLPFMILPLYNALMKIKDDTINGARDLGANEFEILTKIIFPLSLPGVVSGITMVFIPALTTVAISQMLGGGQFLLIGNVIEQEFLITSNWHLGAGISLALIIFIFIVMGITNKYTDKDEQLSFV